MCGDNSTKIKFSKEMKRSVSPALWRVPRPSLYRNFELSRKLYCVDSVFRGLSRIIETLSLDRDIVVELLATLVVWLYRWQCQLVVAPQLWSRMKYLFKFLDNFWMDQYEMY